MITPEQVAQVEKIKEGIADTIRDYDISNGHATQDASVDSYMEVADSLLRTVLADLRIDTGELTPEETFNLGFATPYKSMSTELSVYCQGVHEGAKARAAKFVSIGEIVK